MFRTLNAFLNTGEGGTVYIGVTDEGIVFGVNLNQYQVSLGPENLILYSLDTIYAAV